MLTFPCRTRATTETCMNRTALFCALAVCAMSPLLRADDAEAEPGAEPTRPRISISTPDPTAFHGVSSGAFVVSRDVAEGELLVKLGIGGTASNGVDYAELPASVKLPAGIHSVGLLVQPLGSGPGAVGKWVTLTALDDDAYRVKRPNKATVLIRANTYENQAPTVEITSPANDTSILARTDLPITATASDANDSVKSVSFFANDRPLGSVEAPPYSIVWSNVPPGSHALFARVEDTFGKSTLSATVHLTATNPPPGLGVKLVAPAAGESFKAPADITLTAEPFQDAKVESMTFYAGDRVLETVTAAPFSIVWKAVPPGEYSLRAKMVEVGGASSTSERVKIVVRNLDPVVSITEPAGGTVFAHPTDVPIKAEASDANDSIKSVLFFVDGRYVGKSETAPYSLVWSNAVPGTHLLTARALDSYGESTASTPVSITVSNTAPLVKLIAPKDGTTLPAPATVELEAEASDADGIRTVSLWSGRHYLGTKTTPPYIFTVRNLGPGDYLFRAKATDKFEVSTTSEPIRVTVTRSARD